jgi:hypothetical protein
MGGTSLLVNGRERNKAQADERLTQFPYDKHMKEPLVEMWARGGWVGREGVE